MRKKKYLIKPINFGAEGDLSRLLIEKFEQKNGKQHTSELIRNLVLGALSGKKEFNQAKIDVLRARRKDLKKKMAEIAKELTNNSEELENFGVNPSEFDF